MATSRTKASTPKLFEELNSGLLDVNVPLVKVILSKGELTLNDLKLLSNYKDSLGLTTLHYAAQELMTELVTLLLQDAPPGYINTKNTNGITPLHMAILGTLRLKSEYNIGNLSATDKEALKIPTIQILLNNQGSFADPNITTTSGNTSLHISAAEGHYSISALLLQHDANANLPNQSGNLPLHLAIKNSSRINNENIIIIDQLASVTDNINAENNNHQTALQIAFESERFDIISLLLKNGASPAIKSTLSSDSFLKNHAQAATDMFIELFNKNDGAKEKNILNNALKFSSSSTRKEFFISVIKDFLDATHKISQSNVNSDTKQKALSRQTMLGILISRVLPGEENKHTQDFTDAFFELLKDKKNPVKDKVTLIQLAVNPNEINVGIESIQEKINLNQNQAKLNAAIQSIKKEKSNLYPLHDAIENTSFNQFTTSMGTHTAETPSQTLNKLRPTDNHTPISLAIEKHQWDMVIMLLNAGASSRLPASPYEENLGKNILHLAIEDVEAKRIDIPTFKTIVHTLAEKNHLIYLLDEKSKTHDTPVSSAIKTDNPEVVGILQEESHQLGLFLIMAAKVGTPEILEELHGHIPPGRTLDSYQNNKRETLLHITCAAGYANKAEKLLELGADIHAKNATDETPLHLAAGLNNESVINLLLAKKADPLCENSHKQNFMEVLIDKGFDVSNYAKAFNNNLLFRDNPTKDKANSPSLLRHLFNHYVAEEKIPNPENLQITLTNIAKINPEGFYKEFKAEFDRLRTLSNSGKIKPEAKLVLLKKNRKLCELVQSAEFGLEKLRQVKFHSFMKSPLPAKLIAAKNDLTEKIDVLDRMIHKLQSNQFSARKR